MTESYYLIPALLIFVRLIAALYCIWKARQLGRNLTGWAIFAIAFPVIAMIWIQYVKGRVVREEV